MANQQSDGLFGLDSAVVKTADWQRSIKRIRHDIRSDFIYSPHLNFIYSHADAELVSLVCSELSAGKYSSGVPLTIEVPKASRIRISRSRRFGPSFSRPGSILLPQDRLLYQMLADAAAPIVEAKTDHRRSFSHWLSAPNSDAMFLPIRKCWSNLQKALAKNAKNKENKYVLKLDIANCFATLNLHTLINDLSDCGYKKNLSKTLERLLTQYTGDRSSRGILQGIYPSDLLGNFYLVPIDRFLADFDIPSARYVDDIYIFLKSIEQADQLMKDLVPMLRSYDLTLNESKSLLMPTGVLLAEEPDLEELFEDAVEEISEQLKDESFEGDYGFQREWEDQEDEEDESRKADLELAATKMLFNSIDQFPGREESIERFCLPLFTTARSNYAVDHVINSFKLRPSMAQIYCAYLSQFVDRKNVYDMLGDFFKDEALGDWQRMFVLAALHRRAKHGDDIVRVALATLREANRHEALRAVAAIFVGRFGDHARRRSLIAAYSSTGSTYIQSAIYFASRYFPAVERRNAEASWSAHSPMHRLLSAAMKKKSI